MRLFLAMGAINAFIAVAAGAFGAHGLKSRVEPTLLGTFETAARYQMYHALGLIAVAWLVAQKAPAAQVAGWLMLAGVVLFCGSLYLLVLTGTRWLGAITPIGGLCFMAAWAICAYGALKLS